MKTLFILLTPKKHSALLGFEANKIPLTVASLRMVRTDVTRKMTQNNDSRGQNTSQFKFQQDCIPVGSVPPAH